MLGGRNRGPGLEVLIPSWRRPAAKLVTPSPPL